VNPWHLNDMPLVEARVDGASGRFGIDTGNGASTLVFPQWAEREGLAQRYAKGMPYPTGGVGGRYRAQVSHAGSVQLGRGVRVGGQAGFADHVKVGDGAQIAAQSGVIGDVPAGSVVAGYPAVERWRWLRATARALREGRAPKKPT
jgi:hypothetical protein